jgi:hypothetical protein
MDRRHTRRKSVILHGELIIGDTNYLIFIANISEYGMFMRVSPAKTAADFIPGTTSSLKIKIPTEEIITLHGEIKWLHSDKSSPNIFMNSLGMEIIDPPTGYKAFVETILSS